MSLWSSIESELFSPTGSTSQTDPSLIGPSLKRESLQLKSLLHQIHASPVLKERLGSIRDGLMHWLAEARMAKSRHDVDSLLNQAKFLKGQVRSSFAQMAEKPKLSEFVHIIPETIREAGERTEQAAAKAVEVAAPSIKWLGIGLGAAAILYALSIVKPLTRR